MQVPVQRKLEWTVEKNIKHQESYVLFINYSDKLFLIKKTYLYEK